MWNRKEFKGQGRIDVFSWANVNVFVRRHRIGMRKVLIFNIFGCRTWLFCKLGWAKLWEIGCSNRRASCLRPMQSRVAVADFSISRVEMVAVCDLFVSLAVKPTRIYGKKNIVIDCSAVVFCHRLRTDFPTSTLECHASDGK